jgi:hypothetical protein
MTNVININSKDAIQSRVTSKVFSSESALYFNVWERPSYFRGRDGYYEDPSHKHIVRLHNDQPVSIGLVGNNYKLLKNRELFEGIEKTFEDVFSSEELNGVIRKDQTSYLGGTCYRDYIFPTIKVDISSKRSDVAFRVIAVNGYDGTSGFKLYSGAIDFFCTNGMVSGSFDMMVKRHTKGLTIPNMTDRIRRSIDIFYKQADIWKHWVHKNITDEAAEECFKSMPNISDRRVDQLMRRFRIECAVHNRTVWALYSAATSYATVADGEFKIRETGVDHKATTLMNREQQVRSWLNTDEFLKLAA